MTRLMIALILLAGTAACGDGGFGNGEDSATAPPPRHMPLDPDPPLSSSDIDAIVAQSGAKRAQERPTTRVDEANVQAGAEAK